MDGTAFTIYRVETQQITINPGETRNTLVSCNSQDDTMVSAGFRIGDERYAQIQGLIPSANPPYFGWTGQIAHYNGGGNNFSTYFQLYGICFDFTP